MVIAKAGLTLAASAFTSSLKPLQQMPRQGEARRFGGHKLQHVLENARVSMTKWLQASEICEYDIEQIDTNCIPADPSLSKGSAPRSLKSFGAFSSRNNHYATLLSGQFPL